jgi:hypothetical protein
MRGKRRFATASVVIVCACLSHARPADGLEIRASFTELTASEGSVLAAAIDRWEDVILDSFVFDLQVSRLDPGSDAAARSLDFAFDGDGRPSSARLELADTTNDLLWFVDPTPGNDEEYRPDGHLTAVSGGPAAERVDLLTVFNHELAHALGFTVAYPLFAARITTADDGSRTFAGDGFEATLTSAGIGTHLDSFVHPFDLLNAELTLGNRLYPSTLDVRMLESAFNYDVNLPSDGAVPEPSALLLMLCGLAIAARAVRS